MSEWPIDVECPACGRQVWGDVAGNLRPHHVTASIESAWCEGLRYIPSVLPILERGEDVTNPKGTQLETAAVRWFREHGWCNARRIVKEGVRDKGDVTLGDGIAVTIEAKNTKALDLAGGQKELAAEMENAGHHWGFTIHKRRGTTDVGEYYAVLPVAVLNAILRQAIPAGDSRRMPPRKRSIPRRGP